MTQILPAGTVLSIADHCVTLEQDTLVAINVEAHWPVIEARVGPVASTPEPVSREGVNEALLRLMDAVGDRRFRLRAYPNYDALHERRYWTFAAYCV